MGTQHQKLGISGESDLLEKDEWGSPLSMYRWLSKYFDFKLDAAATKQNALCDKFFTKKTNGLKQCWKTAAKDGDVWLNHPYSQNEKWIKKCYKESRKEDGLTICNLGPADTGCRYWRMYYKYCTGIYLICGRVKFAGAKHSATFSSGIYIFGHDKLAEKYNPDGHKVIHLNLPPRLRGGVR